MVMLSSPNGGDGGDGGVGKLPSMSGSHKKIIYLIRHAEAEHNVKEREAVQRVIASGETCKKEQDRARRAVLKEDPSLRDAPLSADGTVQARESGKKMCALYGNGKLGNGGGGGLGGGKRKGESPFRHPNVVLVSPLRRALMTATELFLIDGEAHPAPRFVAVEALREKRTGLACDERSSVEKLKEEFPHVDFSDVEAGVPDVPMGEDNAAVRARGAAYLDERLLHVEGSHIAIVSHKGWLRELRKTLKGRVDCGDLRADFDLDQWDKELFGNAEVRVAAFRWEDGELTSVVSRSIAHAISIASMAMMGDGFEFALGPPSSGFSIFLADRTTKVHFISIAEGHHNAALRREMDEGGSALTDGGDDGLRDRKEATESLLLREDGSLASEHPLFDARLTRRGGKQADALRRLLAERPSGGRPFTAFDLVIVSPLTRACETAERVFADSPGSYAGVELPPPRILVREECRERYGRYVCDGRRTVTELREEFPTFDFSEMQYDEDVWYEDERESGVACRDRAVRLLEWLAARPEKCVAVVTHTEFLRHLFGQFGDTLQEEDRSILQRSTTNCELRSVVLCAHGNVGREVKDAPASTVRVPSISSLSSMAGL